VASPIAHIIANFKGTLHLSEEMVQPAEPFSTPVNQF
jgi:hypothetical protein